jgi:hypothetical protein
MAGQRQPWGSLSPSYRDRLSKAGITPQMHAAGESIRAARGHEHTPEHPQEGIKDATRFRDWFATRQALVRRVAKRKERLFGDSHKWNGRKNYGLVNKGADGAHPPSIAMLRWALDASDDEWIEALESRDDDYSFLFYH